MSINGKNIYKLNKLYILKIALVKMTLGRVKFRMKLQYDSSYTFF
jgi:hypothetical protein